MAHDESLGRLHDLKDKRITALFSFYEIIFVQEMGLDSPSDAAGGSGQEGRDVLGGRGADDHDIHISERSLFLTGRGAEYEGGVDVGQLLKGVAEDVRQPGCFHYQVVDIPI